MAEEKVWRAHRMVDPWTRFWGYVSGPNENGCWEWTGASRLGYGAFGVMVDRGKSRLMVATRFVWEYLYGPIPNGLHVLHRCDNPPCVRPLHLFLGNPRDNAHDRVSKGRRVQPEAIGRTWQAKGSAKNAGGSNGMAKLTARDVLAIREAYGRERRIVDLALEFHVSQSTISAIVNGKSWVIRGI